MSLEIDGCITRPAANPVQAVLDGVHAGWPALAQAFPDADSHQFWVWANRYGAFLRPELRKALAPFPPVEWMLCGSNDDSERAFANSGTEYFDQMEQVLAGLGTSWADMESVVDFGCGIGRVSRLFAKYATTQKFIGCDINLKGIEWLRDNLGFGDFYLGTKHHHIRSDSNVVDALFSISLFTHLTAGSQASWLKEFHRVLRPGGILFQTVHGSHAMELCQQHESWRLALNVSPPSFEELQKSLRLHGFAWVPHSIETTGTEDYGISFQTARYIAENWTEDFELIGVWSGRIDGWQDLVALRKRHVPVMPVTPAQRLPVEGVTLTIAGADHVVGQPVRLKAVVQGGQDVTYKFYVSECPGYYRPLSHWTSDPVIDYIPWSAGEYVFIVHAASGEGSHALPQAQHGVTLVVV